MKQKTITREEVRLTSRGAIATWPKRGCRAKPRKSPWHRASTSYSPINSLWLPLVRRLKVEMPKTWQSSPNTCLICGKSFFVAWRDHFRGHYLYSLCSDRCVAERRNMLRRRRRREHAEQRQKDLNGRICVHCGGLVQASRNTKRYCLVRCRVAAYRAGRGEASMSGATPRADMPARRSDVR